MSSPNLAVVTISVAGMKRRKKLSAEKASSHEVLSTAHKLGHPGQVLAWAQSKLKLNILKEMEYVSAGAVKTFAGCLDEIVKIPLMNSGGRARAATSQSTSLRSCQACRTLNQKKKSQHFLQHGRDSFSKPACLTQKSRERTGVKL